jgi:hypothetical protein
VLFTARSLDYTAEATRATRDGLRLSEQGQVTDRFARAVEQLGQEDEQGRSRLSIRLGGIYALGRLMNDSPADEPAIMQVLCAFVRTHASASSWSPPPRQVASAADVQAAVTVLAMRPRPTEESNSRLDLINTWISMPDAALAEADLYRASLRRANLVGADLTGASLYGTNLTGARLTKAYLNDGYLVATQLAGADLTGAKLPSAILWGANLSGADLRGADLGDPLTPPPSDKDWSGGGFADLAAADLRGADLRDTGVLSAQIRCSWVDATTKLPPGVVRPMLEAPQRDPACRGDLPQR